MMRISGLHDYIINIITIFAHLQILQKTTFIKKKLQIL